MSTDPESIPPQVAQRMEQWRQRLLDLTRRNRLLYFAPRKTGIVRITGPDPLSLFDSLTNRQATLTFRLPDGAARQGADGKQTLHTRAFPDAPPGRMGERGAAGASGPTSRSSTEVIGDGPLGIGEIRAEADPLKLQTILYRLRLRARSAIEEQGVNTLFLAFGFLQRRESESSSETVSSPLVLVPVSLKRSTALDPYRLSLLEEDEVVLNPTLAERLRLEFGLDMTLPERDEAYDLGEILGAVRQKVAAQPDWRVTEEVFLTHFSFLKLPMYRDLQNNEALMADHPFIRALCGERTAIPSLPDDLPAADELDDRIAPGDVHHILDADSSQLDALATAARGLDLVIEGPPGTGKSQTIANLIAESLAQGKKVLFVSEKRAALEVVYRRLADRSLAAFCLEVHSHRANKRVVLQQLAESLRDVDPGPLGLRASVDLENLAERRKALNDYARALHDSDNALGSSAFRAHGEVAKRAEAPDLQFSFSSAGSVTPAELARLLTLVDRLAAVGHVLLEQDRHPWRGCRLQIYTLELRSEIKSRFGKLRADIEKLRAMGARVAEAWGLEAPLSLIELRGLGSLVALLAQNPAPPDHWFALGTLAPLVESARARARQTEEYRNRRGAILARYDERLFSLDLEETCHRLTVGVDQALQLLYADLELPGEAASAARDALGDLLIRALRTLAIIIEEMHRLATGAGLSAPASLAEVGGLVRVVGLLLKDPRPPRGWLDPAQLLEELKIARVAREWARVRSAEGAEILEAYDLRIVDEASVLSERFATQYVGLLSALRPNYWRDLRRLQTLHRRHHRHTRADAADILARAKRVSDACAWLVGHASKLAVMFGEHQAYGDKDTDWDVLIDALETTRAILDEHGPGDLPAAFCDILVRGGLAQGILRAPYRRLAAAWEELQQELLELSDFAAVTELVPLAGSPAAVQQLLREWHERLRDFWSAEAVVRSAHRGPTLPSVAELVADLAEAAAISRMTEALHEEDDELRHEFGRLFDGLNTDWDGVLSALQWTQSVAEHFSPGAVPSTLVERASGPESATMIDDAAARAFEGLLHDVDDGLEYAASIFEPNAIRPAGGPPENAALDDLVGWLDRCCGNLLGLQEWLDYMRARQHCADAGLDSWLVELDRHRPSAESWPDAFLKRFYQLWLDARYSQHEALGTFRGNQHESLVSQFQKLDEEALAMAPQRVRHAVLSRRPRISTKWPYEVWVLKHEIQKRQRHWPLRRLFRTIPNLLLALKPCLLMSPLSVSQYLDAERMHFDVVIFDEASQVPPEDALGAIFRATQTVISGDPKQLPPTDFFRAQLDDMEDEEEADEDGIAEDFPQEAAGTADGANRKNQKAIQESILDEALALGLPAKQLLWHYRSRDERLIAFSNHYFYGGRLVTFPSPEPNGAERGVEFVYVPDGVYGRGGSRTNRVEAQKVVDLILEHAERHLYCRRTPGEQKHYGCSLGVVAFSLAQMLAIHEELEAKRLLRKDLEPFFDEEVDDPFFIKNLETVQGDQRDVILFSVGYGRDHAGLMRSAFGPVTRAGGERRLNVALTRARDHIKFVSSIQPTDIDITGTRSEGARLLRRYMEFATSGLAAVDPGSPAGGGESESPFEEAVERALEGRGLDVNRQIGCSGYRIDLAVVDDSAPGRYLVGIECDGATYHSSKTARDRDRLRQQVLENKGWRIHRIWSTDWVKDSEGQIRRVLEVVENARQARRAVSLGPERQLRDPLAEASRAVHRSEEFVPQPEGPPQTAEEGLAIYEQADLPTRQEPFFDERTATRVIPDVVASCVGVEGPVHAERVIDCVAKCWGFEDLDDAIIAQIKRGILWAGIDCKVVQAGDFLWAPGQSTENVPVRRPGPGQRIRPIHQVALEELGRACLIIVAEKSSLSEQQVIGETARLLGYHQTGGNVTSRLREALALLIDQGMLSNSNGVICRRDELHRS